MQSHKELQVWQKSIRLVKVIYLLTERFPKNEIFGLTSQMRRAAISIPSNIAEGYARGHRAEYIQFLRTALGSATELETQLIITRELKFGQETELVESEDILREILPMLHKLIAVLNSKAK